MAAPALYVIAGPNGIGKTTSDYDFIPNNIPVINSDEIAAQLKKSGRHITNTQELANEKALELMDFYLRGKSSFGFETNLCDVETWKSLIEIQKQGFRVNVIFISTSDLAVLNSRIKVRVQLGGHFVLPEVVRERYLAGLNLLNHYFHKPDKLQLFDNAVSMQLVAEYSNGKALYVAPELPDWVKQHLGKQFLADSQPGIKARDLGSVDEVRRRYLESKKKPG
ncbi:MAG: hypothetical protein BGO55_08335 [Sphingobacteriales bacterium 50-39]|nr:hypothetical protein [Sphingobacteriales bacterium]OJW59270.1 MAG: hypothetical protein BGO55_08335 [Sphingobacteriales bacterium 50-39]